MRPISLESQEFEASIELHFIFPPAAYANTRPQIGINLADPIFRGIYHGNQRHPDDLGAVVARAKEVGCQKLIVTGSDLTSAKEALEIAREYRRPPTLSSLVHY